MNKKRRNEKGFTMVELVIVIAIMGIIGAVLVPAFSTMSTKARISADLTTVKTLKRTADIYKAEVGNWPTQDETEDLIEELQAKNYLDSGISLQLEDLKVKIKNDTTKQTIKLDLSGVTDENLIKTIVKMDDTTKIDWMVEPTTLPTGVDWIKTDTVD